MKNKKLNACIIGLGQVGIKFDLEDERKNDVGVWTHFSAYERLQDKYNLIAAVDPEHLSWEFAKLREPGIQCFSSIEELINSNLNIDVVSICSPDKFHYQNLKEISTHVKGIFLEKPISTIEDTEQAEILIHHLLETNKSVYVNYYKRAEPSFLKMMEMILKQNEKIKYIECRYSGPFMAVGSHALDLLSFTVQINKIKASVCHEEEEGDGYSAMMIGSNNELINLSYTGKRHEFIFELEVITDKSSYELTNNLQEYTHKKLVNSTQYKGYKEYELTEFTKSSNTARFINYLSIIYDEIQKKSCNEKNTLKSIETQKLIKKITKD